MASAIRSRADLDSPASSPKRLSIPRSASSAGRGRPPNANRLAFSRTAWVTSHCTSGLGSLPKRSMILWQAAISPSSGRLSSTASSKPAFALSTNASAHRERPIGSSRLSASRIAPSAARTASPV